MADPLDYIRGFAVTFKKMFEERVTTDYRGGFAKEGAPDSKREKAPRLHGRHVLNRYEDGMEKCIGCELCAGACPARCIYVRGMDNPADDPVSPGERYGFVYEINMLRCIFCGLCVEACPTEAITMTQLFEMSVSNRDDAIYTKEQLLVNTDGSPNHMFPDDPLANLDELRNADGWMRATAPSGRASYEGVVGWGTNAGVGTRPAEAGQTAEQSGGERPEAGGDTEEHDAPGS